MSLNDTLMQDMKAAMKAKDQGSFNNYSFTQGCSNEL